MKNKNLNLSRKGEFPFCTTENYDNIAGVPEPINQSNVAPLKMIMLSAYQPFSIHFIIII